MDRNQLAQEMVDKLKGQGSVFLTEVATPGARPSTVKDEDIAKFPKERQDW